MLCPLLVYCVRCRYTVSGVVYFALYRCTMPGIGILVICARCQYIGILCPMLYCVWCRYTVSGVGVLVYYARCWYTVPDVGMLVYWSRCRYTGILCPEMVYWYTMPGVGIFLSGVVYCARCRYTVPVLIYWYTMPSVSIFCLVLVYCARFRYTGILSPVSSVARKKTKTESKLTTPPSPSRTDQQKNSFFIRTTRDRNQLPEMFYLVSGTLNNRPSPPTATAAVYSPSPEVFRCGLAASLRHPLLDKPPSLLIHARPLGASSQTVQMQIHQKTIFCIALNVSVPSLKLQKLPKPAVGMSGL